MHALRVARELPRLGRYETVAKIGEGGMATIYAARLRGEGGFEKLVAIKRILSSLAEDEEAEAMFLDEARLAGFVRSAHAVSTLELGRTDDGGLFMVLDLVIGGTLRRWLKRQWKERTRPDLSALLEWLAQAATGLHDAHEATSWDGEPLQLVHRDVAPDNILIGLDGIARISDFGIARAERRLAVSRVGSMKGKLPYSSPEQIRSAFGEGIDRRSDIFSLGVVAWEALAGQRLFYDSKNVALTIHNLLEKPVPDVHEIRLDVPPEVSTILQRALERDPVRRYPDALEMAEDLRRAAAQAGLRPARDDLKAQAWEWFRADVERLFDEISRHSESQFTARAASGCVRKLTRFETDQVDVGSAEAPRADDTVRHSTFPPDALAEEAPHELTQVNNSWGGLRVRLAAWLHRLADWLGR